MCNNFILENYRLTHRPTATIQWSRIQNISIGIIQQKIGAQMSGSGQAGPNNNHCLSILRICVYLQWIRIYH